MSPLVSAASFDCKKATTYAEKEICSDALLGKLDDALSENYNAILATDLGDDGKDLKKTQRAWIAVRNKCTTNKCLVDTYRLRVDEVCDAPVISGVHANCKQSNDIAAAPSKSSSTPTNQAPPKTATTPDNPVIASWLKTCMPFAKPLDMEKQISDGKVTWNGIKVKTVNSADAGAGSLVSLTLEQSYSDFNAQNPELSKKIKLPKNKVCPLGITRSLSDQSLTGEKGATVACNCPSSGD